VTLTLDWRRVAANDYPSWFFSTFVAVTFNGREIEDRKKRTHLSFRRWYASCADSIYEERQNDCKVAIHSGLCEKRGGKRKFPRHCFCLRTFTFQKLGVSSIKALILSMIIQIEVEVGRSFFPSFGPSGASKGVAHSRRSSSRPELSWSIRFTKELRHSLGYSPNIPYTI
jgi:hypothetical protein